MKSDRSWIGSMTTIERAFPMERTSEPQPSATAHPRLSRASSRGGTEVPIGRSAGGHGEAGMESEEWTAFEFLPRREPCRNPSGSPVKRRFDRSQKWQDEFETHSENLTAMEAHSSTGLPKVKTASLRDDILPRLDILTFGADFSVRSSVRIEETRISQTRCLDSVFLLSYSRLRSSPSTWICAPLVSVLANSESLPNTTQRCHSVCEVYPPLFL